MTIGSNTKSYLYKPSKYLGLCNQVSFFVKIFLSSDLTSGMHTNCKATGLFNVHHHLSQTLLIDGSYNMHICQDCFAFNEDTSQLAIR